MVSSHRFESCNLNDRFKIRMFALALAAKVLLMVLCSLNDDSRRCRLSKEQKCQYQLCCRANKAPEAFSFDKSKQVLSSPTQAQKDSQQKTQSHYLLRSTCCNYGTKASRQSAKLRNQPGLTGNTDERKLRENDSLALESVGYEPISKAAFLD